MTERITSLGGDHKICSDASDRSGDAAEFRRGATCRNAVLPSDEREPYVSGEAKMRNDGSRNVALRRGRYDVLLEEETGDDDVECPGNPAVEENGERP